jgi:hypothetical protein
VRRVAELGSIICDMHAIPKYLSLIALLLMTACSTHNEQIAPADIDWPSKVQDVAIGVTREEVMTILPAWRGPEGALLSAPRVTTITGAGRADVFWVSHDWRVTVLYDHAGGMGSRQNRVRQPVRMERIRYAADS